MDRQPPPWADRYTQLHHTLSVPRSPQGSSMRIVSLLPSATEIVCELGLGAALVGVTHECDHPAEVRGLPRVTRTLIPTDASSR